MLSLLHGVQQADMFGHTVCTMYRASDNLYGKLKETHVIGSSTSGGGSCSPQVFVLSLVAQNNH